MVERLDGRSHERYRWGSQSSRAADCCAHIAMFISIDFGERLLRAGGLLMIGFWNTGSPTPSKSNGTQTEIMQSISCMPHRDASPEVRFSISPSCPLTYGCFILRNIVLRLINKLKSPEGYALLMYLWEATASHLRLSPPS